MKKLFIISIAILASTFSQAQFQTGINQGAFQNLAPELENPALSMNISVPQINFMAGTRIDGFNNRPVFQHLFFSSSLGNNTGAAMHVRREKAGLSTVVKADLSFLYTLNIAPEDAKKIVFHGTASLGQNSFNIHDAIVNDIGDPVLTGGTINQPTVNAAAGLAFFSQNTFYAGITVAQLIPTRSDFMNNLWANEAEMLFSFQAAYQFSINEYSSLQAWGSGALSSGIFAYQAGLDYKYRKIFWVGAGYRDNSSLIFNAGVTAQSFSFGYSISYSSWADAVSNGATYATIRNVMLVRKVFNERKSGRE